MKIHEWSVVRTPDKQGLALKNAKTGAHTYEVCVAVRDGKLQVNIYTDGEDEPVAVMKLNLTGESK